MGKTAVDKSYWIKAWHGSKFSKKHQFFQFEISLPQASRQKETYILPPKRLQNFEEHDHQHCRDIHFWAIYNFSKWPKWWQVKYEHLMLPGEFLYKVIPDINFTDETVVRCEIPVKFFLGDGNLQTITNKFWC